MLRFERFSPLRHCHVQSRVPGGIRQLVEAEECCHERDGLPEELLLLNEPASLMGRQEKSTPWAEYPADLGERRAHLLSWKVDE